jgi:LPS-assembly protein
MLKRLARVCGLAVVLCFAPAYARAQCVLQNTISDSREITNAQKDWHFISHVEIECGDTKIYADDVKWTTEKNHAIATGSVVVAQGNNRIAAERADFNTDTGLGIFYNASGVAFVQPPKQAPRPGAGIAVPQVPGQENVVYFFGDTVEKLGPKKYKIKKGGFTTCVQPTPRWDLHADTVVLNVDHYTFLKSAVLTVKGVPMFYLPVMYYPTKKGDRATGFLLPTYGSSTYRGQAIHNAFFWAIDRSQDATLLYDWFSTTGQGVGSEYRYNFGGGSDGNIRAYLDDKHESSYVLSDGTVNPSPASREYTIIGAANQTLPGNLRARANVNYFSSVLTNQLTNTNFASTVNSQRTFGGNIVGAFNGYTLNATFNHSENFYDVNNSVVQGRLPQINVARNERPLLGSPVYFSATSEYVGLLGESRALDANSQPLDVKKTLSRVDVQPQIRYPFKKWQWFTVNSVVSVRDTFYTRSQDPNTADPLTGSPALVDQSLNRRYFTLQSQILGPLFNRIWDTPDNGYAEKFKHSVEPFLNVTRTSAIDNYPQIVVFDGTDTIRGGTQYAYGLNNRFYAKQRAAPGQTALSREILDVQLSQTYYTNQAAAQFDTSYVSSLNSALQSNFSPIALNVRAMPTNDINATVRAEFDSRYHNMTTLSINGAYSWTGRLQTTAGWTKTSSPTIQADGTPLIGSNGLPVFAQTSQSLTASTTAHTRDNHLGFVYSLNYDFVYSYTQQQRISAFYNAQCCGIAVEYQAYNFPNLPSSFPIPADHRFFLSFTLAGLGNFSPFNGALSGVPR